MNSFIFLLSICLLTTSAFAEEPTYHAGFEETDYGKDGYKAGFDGEEDVLTDAEGKPIPKGLQDLYRRHNTQEDDPLTDGVTDKDEAVTDTEDYGDTVLQRYRDERAKAALKMQGVALDDGENSTETESAEETSASIDYGKIITGESAQTTATGATASGYYDTRGYYQPDNAGIFDAETSYLSESN
jgi:hypothetical protein